ncbi:2-hydroxyacyl-CoA dehydratase [Thermodesulfobacteriota bacterium]
MTKSRAREYTFLAQKGEPKSVKRMKSSAAVQKYQKEWFLQMKERVKDGEPFVYTGIMAPHEILTAMDIPHVVSPWWMAMITSRRLTDRYDEVVAQKGYELCPYSTTVMLGEAMDNNAEYSPMGGLPKFTAIVDTEMPDCSSQSKIYKLWAHERNCPVFTLESTASAPYYPRYPRWWEKIRDHWDEVIEPHRLDYRVEELKALIKFLEVTTGKTFSDDRLREVLDLCYEQEMWWKKARDMIAVTFPAPVDVVDHLANYPAQWHRGTPQGRDLAKMFYEEVKEKIDKGEAAYPNEELRLQWVGAGLMGNTGFYQYFAEKYGAVFVCSWYLSIAADGYARNPLNDPLRALAGKHLFLGLVGGPDWDIHEAKHHKANASFLLEAKCNMSAAGIDRKLTKLAFEDAGIPMLLISTDWDPDMTKSEISRFIETRL